MKLRPYLWFIRNLFDRLRYRRLETHWRHHGDWFVVELFRGAGTVSAFMGKTGQVVDLVLRTGNLGDLVWGRSALGVTPLTTFTTQPLSGWRDFSALCWSFTQVYYVNSRASRLQQKPRHNKDILRKENCSYQIQWRNFIVNVCATILWNLNSTLHEPNELSLMIYKDFQ